MAAVHKHTSSVSSDAQPCPDPSVHEKQHKLSEAASAAALLATSADRTADSKKDDPLGPDGKLSSKSAAASLKYAKAHELPSFPSHGISADSAGKAAMLAKDYKMKELWQPELSTAGSKAALLAHGKGSNLDLWQPSASADGNSAATLAMRNKGLGPQVYQGSTADDKSKALLAATLSVNKGRQQAAATPEPTYAAFPDSQNSAANALSAATASHRTSTMKLAPDGWDSEANQAARVQNLHMDPNMFTEHPNLDIDPAGTKHDAALHASAVILAKKMFAVQSQKAQSSTDGHGLAGAEAAAARSSAAPSVDIKQEALRYISLQDTAHKLAAERLAKIDKDLENEKYREHYGVSDDKSKRLSRRLSLRNPLGRGRATSDGGDGLDDSDDEVQARRIRNQMSQLNSGLSKIDAKKQNDDRAKLLAAAEKRVTAQMHEMDERVFLETGKIPPAMLEEWEEKARKRATEDREEKARHPGKTHIGGGKYMDQSEIEAIALARLQPTLDEINETAEKRRARDEELRLEKEEHERIKRDEKEKNRAQKEEYKRIRSDDKAAAKQEKEEAKARKEEEKRIAKEEKRKSKVDAKDAAAAGATGVALGEVAERVKSDDDEDQAEGPKKSFFGSLRGRRSTNDEKRKSQLQPKQANAAGAALAEVAEKVNPDNEDEDDEVADESEAEGDDRRRRGLLGRFSKEEKRASKHDGPDAAAAAAAGATLGEVAEHVKHEDDEADDDDRKHRGLLGRLSKDENRAPKHEGRDAAAAAAAGATLGEVAEKVKHDDDEPATAEDGVAKHRSALGKLKERFQKNKHEDDAEETHEESSSHNGAVAAAGVTGAAAGTVIAAEAANETDPTEKHHEDADDPTAEDVPPTANPSQKAGIPGGFVPVVPVEQEPIISEASALSETAPESSSNKSVIAPLPVLASEEPTEVTSSEKPDEAHFEQQGTMSMNAIDGNGTLAAPRPDLERHISAIPDRDDDDDDEDTVVEAPGKHKTFVQKVADHVAPLAAVAGPVKPAHKSTTDEEEDKAAQRESATKSHNIGTKIADSVAPMAAAVAPVVPAHQSVARQEKPDADAPEDTRQSAEYENAEGEKKGLRGFLSKLKPHKSKDSGSKLPDFKSVSQKDKEAAAAGKDKPASTLPVAAAAPVIATPAFLSSTDAPPPSTAAHTNPSATTTWAEPAPLHVGTDGPIGDSKKVSGINGNPAATTIDDAPVSPISASSFTRHTDNADRDLDDVSSSGVDEEDVKQGRAGRLASKLGLKSKEDRNKLHKKALYDQEARQHSVTETDDDDQQFEEARDTFDENAAPPPPAVEKKISGVEGKGTKFTENL